MNKYIQTIRPPRQVYHPRHHFSFQPSFDHAVVGLHQETREQIDQIDDLSLEESQHASGIFPDLCSAIYIQLGYAHSVARR